MLMMGAPMRIAAGASMLGAVSVVSVLTYADFKASQPSEVAPNVVIEGDVAATDTTTDVAVADPSVEPTIETADAVTVQDPLGPVGPTFDLVRVDDTGSAVVAGTAEPLAEVAVTLSGAQVETIRADNNGAFVALLQLPAGEPAMTVGLQQLRDGAVVAISVQTVLVVPPTAQAPDDTVPTIVIADPEGAEVLQGGARNVQAAVQGDVADNPLTLDTISYSESGAVVLSGQGSGTQFVRIYVDNEPVETELVPDDGNWRVELPNVDQGRYTLRVDEINDAGKVNARVESPFERVATQDLVASGVTAADTSRVVVQPGLTLWQLAEDTYGDGVKYVQIFNANRDTIRDANLIYPGQIFNLPE